MRPKYKRPLDGRLKELISSHMAKPGDVSKTHPRAEFVMSACRAATAAGPTTKRRILVDMAEAMNCDVGELEFLFDHPDTLKTSPQHYNLEVPDFRQELLLAAE